MMNELIFVQEFEEKQCLKCLCVLTSNCTPIEFLVSKKKEGDGGRIDKTTLSTSLKTSRTLWARGACGWQYLLKSDSRWT
jgi:hypothetical protein